MKPFKQAQKYGRKLAVFASGVALSAYSTLSLAAVDISAATATAKTDVETAGALIIGVVVAIAAIAWIRKVAH